MIKKYRATRYSGKIATVDVSRETDSSVFITSSLGGEIRRAKTTEYESYHDSFDAARDALRARLMSELGAAEHRVNTIKSKLGALDKQEEVS